MEHTGIALERLVLSRLRRAYESEGYRFLVEPSSLLVPEFLQDMNYRPDAIALKGEGGVIIELKLDRSSEKSKHLSDLAAKIHEQKGWDFRLLFMSEQPDLLPELSNDVPAKILITQIEEARQLWQAGHRRAGFLLAWAVLEASVRAAVRTVNKEFRGDLRMVAQVIEAAALHGVISGDQARDLRSLMKTRSAVAHGNFDIDLTSVHFQILDAAIDSALAELLQPDTTTH